MAGAVVREGVSAVRILFGSWPGYGHLLPMLPLIRAAQDAGHEVVVTSGEDVAGLIDAWGVRRHRSGLTMTEGYARLPDATTISALPEGEQQDFAARHLFGAGAVDRARDVLDLLDAWSPDLVVHDTLELGTPTAAAMRGIPHVTHGFGPPVPGLGDFLTTVGSVLTEAGLSDPVPDVLASPYLDICPPSLGAGTPSPWATHVLLRPTAGEPEAGTSTDDALGLDYLPHPDTVYVTLGTVMNQAPEVFRAVIEGCTRQAVNVVATTGPGFDRDLLGPIPPAVRVTPYAAQATVLPRCTAVISHAGAGTMLGALCHGLPQLCLPQSTDQPFNTAALLPTGAALALSPQEVTAQAVDEALGRLLRESSFREAAEQLREEIGRMPDAATVLPSLLAEIR